MKRSAPQKNSSTFQTTSSSGYDAKTMMLLDRIANRRRELAWYNPKDKSASPNRRVASSVRRTEPTTHMSDSQDWFRISSHGQTRGLSGKKKGGGVRPDSAPPVQVQTLKFSEGGHGGVTNHVAPANGAGPMIKGGFPSRVPFKTQSQFVSPRSSSSSNSKETPRSHTPRRTHASPRRPSKVAPVVKRTSAQR
eukprot:40582_1